MGCTISSPFDPVREIEEVENEQWLDKRPRPVKLVNGTGVEITNLEVQDEAGLKPPTGEEGEATLPEGNFINGQLGITDYHDIDILKHELETDGREYEDPDFPADHSSVYFSGKDLGEVEWLRPKELVDEPKLFVDGASRRDVVQGVLGDCWFLSSCSAVAREMKLIERVIAPDQILCGEGYTGLIVCRFWRFGEWVNVCIDDRLPTKDRTLLFARSADPNEFWVALLEKAYAKLHGSYEAMEGGQSMDAMVDLTGGLAERYDLEELEPKVIFKRIMRHSRQGAFITCSRKGDWRMAYKTDDNGLVEGHAYTVSDVAVVRHDELGKVRLIRVRNPWANEAEWKGIWGDSDPNWNGVSEKDKERLALQKDSPDGEFWIGFEDFAKQFEEVSVCTIGPDFNSDGKVDDVEKHKYIKGSWEPGVNAGGSRNDFDLFATNPQFLLQITDTDSIDDDDDSDNGEVAKKANVLVGLLQEHRRSNKEFGLKTLQIAVLVYKAEDPSTPLSKDYFMYNYDEGSSGTYINYREVIARLELEAGYYVIIPATFNPDSAGTFMVRVYADSNFALTQLQ